MTQSEKLKYLRASILAAVGAAAVGAVAKGRKSKKDREKAMDVASSSNAIVVPISKKKFLEGLKTPDEQRAEFEGKRKIESDEKQLLAAPTTDIPASVDVASMKKDILKRRKFDFFGKRASVKAAQPDEKNDGESRGDKKTEVVSEEKIDGRVVLRGQDGKFVSPTDPVAVQDAEKSAGIIGDFKRGLKEHPVALTAGAIGSVMLAAKISDMINERRREKAKSRLEDARSRYVSLLEGGDGNEKVANDKSDSLSNLGGRVVGTAFLVPLALTAMVTNKIIENRKAEKKRRSEMSDSYPQDPTILYRTYDGDTLKIAADTALMAIMVKRAMIDDAERSEVDFIKSAQGMISPSYQKHKDSINPGNDYDKEVEFAVKHMTDPKNRKDLLRFIKAQQAGDEKGMESAYRSMMPFGTSLRGHYGVATTPEFKRALASNKALQDAVVGNLENDRDWKAYRDSQISDRIAGFGLDRGGILHKIIMWLANTLGFGNAMARKYVMSGFDSARDRYQAEIDKIEEEKENARLAKEQEALKNHFAPLDNFKGTQQERDKLEKDLNDSWMVKQVDSINDPESFAMAARNLANLNPGSQKYKTIYDALSKKKDLNPAAFSALAQPSNIASPSQAAPSTAAPNASTTSPATYQEPSNTAVPSPAAPYQGEPARGPVSSNAGLDPQQYQGSEAPDYAEQEMPTVKGLEERMPSYNDASWRILSNIAAAPSNQHTQGLADPELNELLKLETGSRLNPVERPHDNQSWDTVGIDTKLNETPPRPSSVSTSRPPSIVPPSPVPSDEEQMAIIDDAIKNPIRPVVGAPQQPPVGQSAFESNARFRPSATTWTDYVGSNPDHLYNYPVGDYTKSDLGQ